MSTDRLRPVRHRRRSVGKVLGVCCQLARLPSYLDKGNQLARWVETKERYPELFAEAVEVGAKLSIGMALDLADRGHWCARRDLSHATCGLVRVSA